MSNKINIEEDIKILKSYLEQQDRKFVTEYRLNFLKAIENILADRERLEKELKIKNGDIEYMQRKIENHFISDIEYLPIQAKANKYDSLVEKIKEIVSRLKISDIEPWSSYKVSGDILFDLQELLDTEKES